MNAEEIDDVLDALIQNDLVALFKFAELDYDNEHTDSKRLRHNEIIYKRIMQKIEQGDYEYFQSKQNDLIYGNQYLDLMQYSTKKEDIKKIVLNNKNLNINSVRLVNLICATNESEFIIECIKKRKEYGLNSEEVFRLIKDTENKEFWKEVVKNFRDYSLSSLKIFELIKLIDIPEFTKECIKDRKKYGLMSFSLVDLIILADTTKERSYIKQQIQDAIEHKSDIQFDENFDIYNLIKGTGDTNYIKDCVNQKNKYKLSKERVISLLITIRESDFADKCINNREEFNFTTDEILKIILELDDVDYMKKWIEDVSKRETFGIDNDKLHQLILETQESKYIQKCIETRDRLKLDITPAYKLIKATKNPEFIKQCIEQRKEFKLSADNIGDLICATGDSEYIINCLENRYDELQIGEFQKIVEMIYATQADGKDEGKFIKKCIDNNLFNLSPLSKAILIQRLDDPEYTKYCIANAATLGLNKNVFLDIILQTNDYVYIEDFLQEIENQCSQPHNAKILLSNNTTIGVEIETTGDQSSSVQKMTNIIAPNWNAKNDGSLINGAEVTSPILHSNTENQNHSIYHVCKRLEALRTSSRRRLWFSCTYWNQYFNNA